MMADGAKMAKGGSVDKKILVDKIIADLKQDKQSEDYVFGLVRESLMQRSLRDLKEINQPNDWDSIKDKKVLVDRIITDLKQDNESEDYVFGLVRESLMQRSIRDLKEMFWWEGDDKFANGGMMASSIVEKYMHQKNDDVKNLISEMNEEGTDTKKYHKFYKIVVDNIVSNNKEIKREEVEIEVGNYLDNLN